MLRPFFSDWLMLKRVECDWLMNLRGAFYRFDKTNTKEGSEIMTAGVYF